jgi:predicted helicase
MKLQHPAVGDIRRFSWPAILVNVQTLSQFESSLNRDWNSYKSTLNIEPESRKDVEREIREKNKFLGDAFEVFAEMFMLTQSMAMTGVANYRPINFLEGESDIGVDGVGIGNNNKPATVQVKFRSDSSAELFAKEDGLSGFVAASQNVYNVDIMDTFNMCVITNCKGINDKSKEKMLFGKVICLGRAQITELVDDSIPWWNDFRTRTLPPVKKISRRAPTVLI